MPAPARRCRSGRRPLSLALVTGLLLLLCAPAAAAPDSAGPAAGQPVPLAGRTASPPVRPDPDPDADDSPVRVEVTELLPRAPLTADTPLQVSGRLVNTGSEPVDDLHVRLAVGGVVRSRSGLAEADAEPPAGRPRGQEVVPPQSRLAPGARTTFDLRLTVEELGLTQLGVYPVRVQVRGRSEPAGRRIELGTASTFVPWFPAGAPAPSRLAVLWPLVDVPVRTPDGAVLDEEVAERLETSLGEDGRAAGRLAALLAAARTGATGACDSPAAPAPGTEPPAPAAEPCRRDPVPLTYAVDPALLDAVQALAGEHAVADGADRRAAPPSPAAQRWLAGLRDAVADVPADVPADGRRAAQPAADVLALPYGDPDVVALTRSGSGLAADVEQLRLLGRRTAADLLSAEPLDAVAWPPPGGLTSAALDATLGGGATAVVLDEQALPPRRSDLARTPGTRTDLSSASVGPVTGLVVDDGLSRLLAASPEDAGWQGTRLAEQRWVAETAILAAERPGESRTFLVAPPRRGTVVPEIAAAALQDVGRLPWLCPVPLAAVVTGAERCPGVVVEPAPEPVVEPASEDRGDLVPVAEADAGELPPAYVREVAEVRALGTQLTDEVLVPGSAAAADVKARFLRARGRAESSAWRDLPRGGQRMLELAQDDVAAYRGQIVLGTPRGGRQLLTADSGVIDVTITNALDQPITVGVQLNDPVEARLTSTDTDVRTVGPSEVVPVRLRVQARTSGQFVVRARLLDRSGQPFGEPAELVVTSTQFGRLALGITGVGLGVLLVAAGVRIVRRAVRRPATDLEDLGG